MNRGKVLKVVKGVLLSLWHLVAMLSTALVMTVFVIAGSAWLVSQSFYDKGWWGGVNWLGLSYAVASIYWLIRVVMIAGGLKMEDFRRGLIRRLS